MNLSPALILANLRAAFRYAIGRGRPDELFDASLAHFWQSVWGPWIIHLLATSFASQIFGLTGFIKLSIIALISSVAYIIMVSFMMGRIGKSERFLAFIIPYQWLTAFQAACFGMIALLVMMAPNSNAHLLTIPVVIWLLIRTWYLIKDVMAITGGLAVGFILARILLDMVVNFASGIIAPLGGGL